MRNITQWFSKVALCACGLLSVVSSALYAQSPRPDLIITEVRASVSTNPFTLQTHGSVDVTVKNVGSANAPSSSLILYTDRNFNRRYDAGTDEHLGTGTVSALAIGQSASVSASVSGRVLFVGGWISVDADYGDAITELDESNNYGYSGLACLGEPAPGVLAPQLKWAWGTGTESTVRPTTFPGYDQAYNSPAIGDIDGDGFPEVVTSFFNRRGNVLNAILRILDGRDGHEKKTFGDFFVPYAFSPAVADIDRDGNGEIYVSLMDGRIRCIEYDPNSADYIVRWTTSVSFRDQPYGGFVTVADVNGDEVAEIIVARHVFRADGTLLWSGTQPYFGATDSYSFYYNSNSVGDIDLDGEIEVVCGPVVYRGSSGEVKYINETLPDGWTGIGNFDDDPQAEVVLVASGNIYILNHDMTVLRRVRVFDVVPEFGINRGGPPTISDFDGDGEANIGVAGAGAYVAFKANLELLWYSQTQDNSSSITGSTSFDFNGDGRREVLYRDERQLRIYDGATGTVLWNRPLVSGTAIEYPLVADVDADGRADIIVPADNSFGTTDYNGIYVFSNPTWVPTRKVWNQHAYCITNINNDLTVPATEPPSWLIHNTYRCNLQFDLPVTALPDLTISLGRDCHDAVNTAIQVRIGNGGAHDAQGPFVIKIYDSDPTSSGSPTVLGSLTVNGPLPAGEYLDVLVPISPAPTVPNTPVWAMVRSETDEECNLDNNLHVPLVCCVGDVNCDGIVDDADLLAVLFDFGSPSEREAPLASDLNCDGIVDDADLLIVLFNFGNQCRTE